MQKHKITSPTPTKPQSAIAPGPVPHSDAPELAKVSGAGSRRRGHLGPNGGW